MWYLLGLKEKNVRVLVKISSCFKYAAKLIQNTKEHNTNGLFWVILGLKT